MTAGYARWLLERNPTLKIFIANPTPWLRRNLAMFYPHEDEDQVTRDLGSLEDDNLGGIYCVTHAELLKINLSIIRKAFVIVDEGHLILQEPVLINRVLESTSALLLSATFGAAKGLKEIKEELISKGASVATIYPKPRAIANQTRLLSLP